MAFLTHFSGFTFHSRTYEKEICCGIAVLILIFAVYKKKIRWILVRKDKIIVEALNYLSGVNMTKLSYTDYRNSLTKNTKWTVVFPKSFMIENLDSARSVLDMYVLRLKNDLATIRKAINCEKNEKRRASESC